MQNARWVPGRERIATLSTIVIGVLIALAIGAIAARLFHRYEATLARRAIDLELGRIAAERAAIAPCVEARLDALMPLIEQAADSGRLTAIGEFGMPPVRSWPLTGRAVLIAEDSRRELVTWTRLYTMVGPGRATSPAETLELRQAIGEARMLNRRILALTQPARQQDPARALHPEPAAICQPVGAVPEHYGRSPL